MSVSDARDADVGDMRETFLNFDRTGRGNIESKDIGEVMRALGQNPTNEEVYTVLFFQFISWKLKCTFCTSNRFTNNLYRVFFFIALSMEFSIKSWIFI